MMIAASSPQAATTSDQDAYLRRDRCPCCGESVRRSRPVVASNPPAETLSIADHGRFLSGYSAERVFFSYHQCEACGLLYCPLYYTQAQLDRLYGRQAENMAEVSLEARQLTQTEYVRLVTQYSVMDSGFLELGADIGLFAERCADNGHFEKFWLYEPNVTVHDELRRRIGSRDMAIRTVNFSAADVPAASVSTSALIHVLDHLLEPKVMLEEIRRCLRPNGIVLIVTHDCSSLLARLLGRRWPPYTLQHPQLFSQQSLRRTLEQSGLEVLEIASVRNFFSMTHLLRAGLAIFGLPSLLPNWPKPLLGLPLGNMAAIARN
jgi:2-polyprenyl-3-methyl-5-hydroxy-6-metoxy-1,4-benzoquinol methylase